MPDKRYIDFTAGTPEPTHIFLISHPVTGLLKSITLQDFVDAIGSGIAAPTWQQTLKTEGVQSYFTQNNLIQQAGYSLNFQGTLGIGYANLGLQNFGTGSAISVLTAGPSVASVVIGNSTSGQGINVTSQGGYAIVGVSTDATNLNTVINVIRVQRSAGVSAGANGIGAGIEFYVRTSSTSTMTNEIISKWTDATTATRTSELSFTGYLNGTPSTKFKIKGSGVINIATDPGNHVDNAAAVTAGLSTGDIYRNGDILMIVH